MLLTRRSRRYESNATWTDQIGVKTKILWPIEGSGSFVNRWNLISEFKIIKIRFETEPGTAGMKTKKYRGSFERMWGRRVEIQIIIRAFLQNYRRRGILRSGPLDRNRTVQIRSEGRGNSQQGRRVWNMVYGTRIHEPKTSREREESKANSTK